MWLSNDLLVFPLISLTNRFFCAGTIVLLAWKPLSYPPPLFPYQFSRLLLLPRTRSNILHFHDRYGTVFPPLSSTVDSRQLKPSGKSRSKVKSEWNYVRISKTKPPRPNLRRPWVKLLTKLASLFFTVIIFIFSHFSAPFFNKIKSEKLSERVYRFKVLLFIK